jgi:hypothetical protein
VSDTDDATVTIDDVGSAGITVTKDATPLSLPEPGGTFTFDVTVTNDSTVDTVTIDTLSDDIYLDLTTASNSDCAVPQVLAPGATYSCSFEGDFTGNAGDEQTDVVTASGTDDDGAPVSDTDDATVTILAGTGQIAPTATSCQDFVSGNAGDLTEIGYGVKSGKVNNVAPGVLFYYSFVVAPSSTFTVTVNQSDTPDSPFPAFGVHQGQAIFYNPNCTKRASTVMTVSGGGALVTFSVSGATTGARYVVGIKYNPGTVVGTSVSTPHPSAIYTFSTSLNGSLIATSPDSLVLKKK